MSLPLAALTDLLRRAQRSVQRGYSVALGDHYAALLGGTDGSASGLVALCQKALGATAEPVAPPEPVEVETPTLVPSAPPPEAPAPPPEAPAPPPAPEPEPITEAVPEPVPEPEPVTEVELEPSADVELAELVQEEMDPGELEDDAVPEPEVPEAPSEGVEPPKPSRKRKRK